MHLRQLEYFVAISRAGSFTAAAEQLYVAQPSISQQIRALEKELGCQLLERRTSGVDLTSAGRVFLPEATAILDACKNAKQSVRAHVEGRSGELHILTVRSVAVGVLPSSLIRWHELFPRTVVRLKDFSHRRDLESAFRDGLGDVAIGPRPNSVKDGDIVPLGYEELLLVSPESLHQQNRVEPAELSDRDWVLFEQDHGLTEVIDAFCAEYDVRPKAVARTWQVEAALLLSVEGLGVTMLPENVIPNGWIDHTTRVGSGVFRELVAYCRTGSSPAARKYVELLDTANLPLHRSEEIPPDAFTL